MSQDFLRWVPILALVLSFCAPRTHAGDSVSTNSLAAVHWAFVPPAADPVPASPGSPAESPVDAFVLAKLRELKIEPVPPATRSELLRRVTLDLTGLPPTTSEL